MVTSADPWLDDLPRSPAPCNCIRVLFALLFRAYQPTHPPSGKRAIHARQEKGLGFPWSSSPGRYSFACPRSFLMVPVCSRLSDSTGVDILAIALEDFLDQKGDQGHYECHG